MFQVYTLLHYYLTKLKNLYTCATSLHLRDISSLVPHLILVTGYLCHLSTPVLPLYSWPLGPALYNCATSVLMPPMYACTNLSTLGPLLYTCATSVLLRQPLYTSTTLVHLRYFSTLGHCNFFRRLCRTELTMLDAN